MLKLRSIQDLESRGTKSPSTTHIWINLSGGNGLKAMSPPSGRVLQIVLERLILLLLIIIRNNMKIMGQNAKFHASKLARKTEIDEIFKKKKSGPSPVSYKPQQIKSKKGVFNSKLHRSGFIEDAKARSKDSPAPYTVNYTQVKPRIRGRSFLPTKKTNMDPIKKVSKPDMGSYKTESAYLKTKKRVRVPSMIKNNIPMIQDLKIKQTKNIPGVGSYQWDKSFNHSTRAPLFRKGRY